MNIEVIHNKEVSEIWVNGELWKKIRNKLYKSHLSAMIRCQTKKELTDLALKVDLKITRGIVYKLLAIRGYLKAELRTKLKKDQIPLEAIETILEECERLGYLDDQREGNLFIAQKKRQGWGPRMIAHKLAEKDPTLKEMVRERVTDEEQIKMIQKWIEKKTKGEDLSDLKIKNRLHRFLRGKGFDDDLIREKLFTP